MVIRFLFLLIVLTSAQSLHAGEKKIYVWHNSEGVLVFSDTPRPGAKEVKLNSNTISMPTADTSILNEKPTQPQELVYEIEIVSPKHEATIRDNAGSVHVSGRILPNFTPGFQVQLLLDGAPYGDPKSSSVFVMRDVDRGEHSLELKLLDQLGEVVAISRPITFYMHRRSVITGP